ncbi:hypothetical protein DC20_20410 [Rufibacter tibetensis]|uniref:Uncharacterized protein n=1 Tax=Rufibacter tibetensis TaxID=512763 RepID=A0A0P0CB93_9BACT|nr:hypothetical protein DC20_20410 [Rufibacter tibetensis]
MTGSCATLATCWVGELRFVWVADPRCITQDRSLQDFIGFFEAFLQQQLGSAKKPMELLFSPEHCDTATRKPIEAIEMATIKLRCTSLCNAFIRRAILCFRSKRQHLSRVALEIKLYLANV